MTKTTYNTKDLMAGLCEILPRLDIVIASNVKIDSEQARRLNDVFGYAREGIPMSWLFDNVDGHNMHVGLHEYKLLDEGTVAISRESSSCEFYENAALYQTVIHGHHNMYSPMYILFHNNKVVDWDYSYEEFDSYDEAMSYVDDNAFRNDM